MDYGWPTSYMGARSPILTPKNHTSSIKQPAAVDKFIAKEISLNGLIGQLIQQPFQWFRLNPLMARPKKDTNDYRIILDLSYPEDLSVNSSIPKVIYEGSPYKLHLPTPLDFSEIIARKGQGAYLYKVDLARAYRQLPSDPFDWPLLGINWNSNYYIDKAIPFGLRHGAMTCQRVTEAVCYILEEQHKAEATRYIDGFGGAAGQDKTEANTQYIALKTILLELGLSISWDKCVPTTRILTWTATTFNTGNLMMKIDEEKVAEALQMAQAVLNQGTITLKQVESLIGKLTYASKLSEPARKFMNRILNFRRNIPEIVSHNITWAMQEDLKWFLNFLHKYNCRALIRSRTQPTEFLFTDACLVGGGALLQDHAYFAIKWPPHLLEWNLNITELEIYTILIAFREWIPHLAETTVQVWSDNEATVLTIRTGKTRNLFLADCIRELWYICATADVDIIISHIAGKDNQTADMLSRRFCSTEQSLLFNLFKTNSLLAHSQITSAAFKVLSADC